MCQVNIPPASGVVPESHSGGWCTTAVSSRPSWFHFGSTTPGNWSTMTDRPLPDGAAALCTYNTNPLCLGTTSTQDELYSHSTQAPDSS